MVSGHEVRRRRQEKSNWQKEKEGEDKDAGNNFAFSAKMTKLHHHLIKYSF